MNFYNKYNKKYYSQWGEEGIILEICKRLNIEFNNKWVCEFGAWDGINCSNTFYFIKNFNCNGIYIEGDKERYKNLIKTSNLSEIKGKIISINKFVNNNLDNILSDTNIPEDFLILSIDVDGIDYHIWKACEKYKPIIVIIEIDSGIPPPLEHIYGEKNNTGLVIQGTTFQSMLILGEKKGYKFVCHTGNMIFVREDYFDKLNLNYKFPFENFCTRHIKSEQNKKLLEIAQKKYI